MPLGPMNPKEWGFYVSLSQVGMEMAAPIVVGALVDSYLGWKPWGVVAGVILGFAGGLTHLLLLVNRHDRAEATDQEKQP